MVVEERMRSSGWLMTGRVSGHENSEPVKKKKLALARSVVWELICFFAAP